MVVILRCTLPAELSLCRCRVCPLAFTIVTASRVETLHDFGKQCEGIDARNVRGDARTWNRAFSIVAFSLVNERSLVVQTDFGRLDIVQSEWRFWDGPILPCSDRNLMTENGLVLCPSGASVYGNSGVTVPFPLSSHVSPLRKIVFFLQNSLISLEQFEFPHYLLWKWRLGLYGRLSECIHLQVQFRRGRRQDIR